MGNRAKPVYYPNQIVRVQHKGYTHHGEVMSYVTPEERIMVRRVPGHPGTLEELPVESLLLLDGPIPTHVHYAVGTGKGSFPLDMLRYDFAAPVNFQLEEDGPRLMPRVLEEFGMDGLWIATCTTRGRHAAWTPERWRSFNWNIEPRTTESLKGVKR